MDQNLAHFARMAAPRGSRPPQGYSAPSTPVRAPMNPASRMGAQGRGGDTMMAHMTPGEIAVPPQVQTPEVLSSLNKAFASAGANPTSFQAGSPDQKVNPETGLPEFGFFDMLLPTVLGIAGSAFLGPAVIGPALGIAEGAGGLAGALPGIIGGGIGSTAGNLITGKGPLQSILGGFGGAAGGALGSAALGGGFGSGPAAAVPGGALNAAPPLDLSDISRNVAASGASPGSPLQTALQSAPAAAAPSSGLDGILKTLMPGGIKGALGSFVGSEIGSQLAQSLVPGKKASTGPSAEGPFVPPPPLAGGAVGSAPMFPDPRRYRPGMSPMFNYFPGR